MKSPVEPDQNTLTSSENAREKNKATLPSQSAPRAPWVLILPLALAAGVLLQQTQKANRPNVPLNGAPVANVANNAPDESHIGQTQDAAARYILFTPTDNGELRRQTVVDKDWLVGADDLAEKRDVTRMKAATRAVRLLMERYPADFPKNSRLEAVQVDDNVTELNFNRAFITPSFWQGSTRITISLYSLVNTTIESEKSVAKTSGGKVRLLVEGQPISALGDFDTTQVLAPDYQNMEAR